jgi:hypothetical protein
MPAVPPISTLALATDAAVVSPKAATIVGLTRRFMESPVKGLFDVLFLSAMEPDFQVLRQLRCGIFLG